MNYKEDQIGIFDRFQNEFDNWQPHLLNSKEFILKNCQCIHQKPVAILGSGWLLDVPTNELIQKFPKVVCFDIIHPDEIRYKYRNNRKIEFKQMDLTGGAAEFFFQLTKNISNPASLINEFIYKEFDFSNYEMVISLNLLNQLDRMVVDYLSNFKAFTPDHLHQISKTIQQNHIANICQVTSIAIFDYEEQHWKNNKFVNSQPLIFCDFPSFERMEEWDWRFDFHKAYYPDHDVIFKVKALKF